MKVTENDQKIIIRTGTVRSGRYIYSMLNVFYIFFHFRLLFLLDPRAAWRMMQIQDPDPQEGRCGSSIGICFITDGQCCGAGAGTFWVGARAGVKVRLRLHLK